MLYLRLFEILILSVKKIVFKISKQQQQQQTKENQTKCATKFVSLVIGKNCYHLIQRNFNKNNQQQQQHQQPS